MNPDQITITLNKILEDLGFVAVEAYEHEVTLKNLLGLDSLDFVELIMKVEQEFKVVITNAQAAEVTTFGQLITLIHDLKS